MTISTHGISPALYPKLPYDPQDFSPIANIGLTPQVLMTSLKSGIGSVADLVAKAKGRRRPQLRFLRERLASHLAVEMLEERGRHQAPRTCSRR